MASALLTEAEYEALPASVQRKYFSSLERLRIAEHSGLPYIRAADSQIPSTTGHRRTRTATSALAVQKPGSKATNRLRKSHALPEDCKISQAEAQWFVSLPDKVRRRYFSREEQVLLAARCETVLLDAADEALQQITSRRRDQAEESIVPLPIEKPRSSENSVLAYGWDNTHQGAEADIEHSADMFPFEACSSLQQRRGSFRRRTLSLKQNPFARYSTSSVSPLPSPTWSLSNHQRRPRATSNGQSETSRPIFDPEAKHYMDPEARAKLRLYLASPQKFDEVLEFGFPSTSSELPSTPPENHSRHIVAPRQVNHDVLAFLQGDPVSFLDDSPEYTKYDCSDSDEDTSTIGDADSPVTPCDGQDISRHMRRLPSSNGSSLDNTSFPFPCSRQTRYAEAMAGNREMTLRVTLTRPDLRAADDELYGWQKSGAQAKLVSDDLDDDRDPLALEALPPMTDDTTGSHCPFTTPPPSTRQTGLVKRLLKKMRSVRG